MGGSSKKTTVAFKYSLGMHLVWHLGMGDRCLRFQVDKRTAWEGSSTGGRIDIDAPKLFGGEKKEGGIVGAVDFETGGPAQQVNDYLASKLGALIPAFRGVTATVLRQVYLGLNPYLKPWSGRFQRIHLRHDGLVQWYDAKAAINSSGEAGVTFNENFNTGLAPYTVTDGSISAFSIADDIYGKALEVNSAGNTRDAISRSVSSPSEFIGFSTKCRITAAAVGGFGDMEFSGPDGSLGLGLGGYNEYDPPNPVKPFIITPVGSVYFTESLVFDVWHQVDVTFTGNDGVATLRRLDTGAVLASMALPSGGDAFATVDTIRFVNKNFLPGTSNRWADFQLTSLSSIGDMNPAHIIRECLTDPDWGMGYSDADIDDLSFMAAADTLHGKGFGLSTLWSRQTTLESFIQEILRHINAVLYVDRTTGKFVLKLILNDYNHETLPILNEGNIDKIESLSRPSLGEMVNSVSVIYWDRNTGKDASITVQDIALIQQQGCIINTTVQYPAVTNGSLASRLAQRDLRTLSYPLLRATLIANRTVGTLDVGSPFRFQWADTGIDDVVMRVTEISPGDGKSRKVRVIAVQDVFGLPTQSFVTPVEDTWVPPVSAPQPSPARLVIEAPYLEIVQNLGQTMADYELAEMPEAGYLLVAAQRPSDDSINAELQVDAGAGYDEAGVLDFCPVASLLGPIGPTDYVVTLTDAVDVGDIRVGDLAQLGAELVRIDAITPTSATIGRGVLDTVPVAHAAGEKLWGIDLYAASDFTQYVDGETLSAKVLPTTGQGELDLADAPVDSVTMAARAIRPYPPADVRINGASFPPAAAAPVTLTWVTRNRLQQTGGTLVDWFDATITPEAGQTTVVELWSGATLVESWPGETDGTVTLTVATSGTYTVRAYSQRAGHDSWTAFEHTLEILGGAERVSESGVARITENGILRGNE